MGRVAAGAIALLVYSALLWTVRRYGLLTAAVFAIAALVAGAVPAVIPSWWSGRINEG